jgi:hypothetical protein
MQAGDHGYLLGGSNGVSFLTEECFKSEYKA